MSYLEPDVIVLAGKAIELRRALEEIQDIALTDLGDSGGYAPLWRIEKVARDALVKASVDHA